MTTQIKTQIGILALLTFLFIGCKNAPSSYQEVPLSEEQLKEQLRIKECSTPSKYFEGNLKYVPRYKNALSMKVKALKLNCNIKNNAVLTTFTDVQFHVVFSSKTGTIILENDFTVFDFFAPGETVNYKTEMEIGNQQYKDISDFKWTIVGASCQEQIEEYVLPD